MNKPLNYFGSYDDIIMDKLNSNKCKKNIIRLVFRICEKKNHFCLMLPLFFYVLCGKSPRIQRVRDSRYLRLIEQLGSVDGEK